MLPALIVFSICGSLLAVLLEGSDRGLRCQREIKDSLGIPCIGLVPQIPRDRLAHVGAYLLTEPFSAYAEAIRSVAAMLQVAEPGHGHAVLLISSSISGEGKTTLAQSLAAYIGHLGRRMLLVSLDFRQGSRIGGCDGSPEGGMVDLSFQNRPVTELIRYDSGPGFDYLVMPGHCLNPLRPFASEQMRELRERYDCVIIDGPAVLGAVEARLLCSMADKLLMVVKWGSTRREVAQNALSLLRDWDEDRIDVARAIVTQVNLKKHARYRYGDMSEFLVDHGKQPRSIEMRLKIGEHNVGRILDLVQRHISVLRGDRARHGDNGFTDRVRNQMSGSSQK
jgi:cellulose biosynthesis protein BcsQ